MPCKGCTGRQQCSVRALLGVLGAGGSIRSHTGSWEYWECCVAGILGVLGAWSAVVRAVLGAGAAMQGLYWEYWELGVPCRGCPGRQECRVAGVLGVLGAQGAV